MARSLLVIDDFFIEVGEAVWLHTLVIDAVSMESGVAHAALAALQDQLRAAEAFRFLSLLFQNVPNSIRELNEHPRLEHIMCHVILQNSFKELLIKQVNDPASAFLVASLFRQMVDPVKRPLSKNTIFINYVNKNDTFEELVELVGVVLVRAVDSVARL